MKKLTLILRVFLFATFVATWSSCHNQIEVNPNDYSSKQKQICLQLAGVHADVLNYYTQCSSISELKQNEEQIRSINHVKDVYFTDICMFVDVEDFGPIAFAYFPKVDSSLENEFLNEINQKLQTRAGDTHPMLNLHTAVIANQQANDEKMQSRGLCADYTKEILEGSGFTVAPINNAPSVDFFNREMFDYDIVFIMTHGVYNDKGKLHWLLTGETKNDDNSYAWYEWILSDKGKNDYDGYTSDQVSFVTITETRAGKEENITYAMVSEKFIDNSQYSFKNRDKAIVFNMACQSVMGPNPETEDSINYSMAQVFVDKGVGTYLGYDQSNCTGQTVGVYYFLRLISGMSTLNAYNNLTFWNRHNFCQSNKDDVLVGVDGGEANIDVVDREVVEEHWADLLIYPNTPRIGDSYILKPQPQLEIAYPLFATEDLELKANCKLYNINNNEAIFAFGFDVSESEDFNDANRLCFKRVGEEGCTFLNSEGMAHYKYKPSTSDNLKLMTRYYCRAFFFNGYDYYYSDTQSFVNRTQDSDGTIPDIPGTDF
jgi:hypothetical protein